MVTVVKCVTCAALTEKQKNVVRLSRLPLGVHCAPPVKEHFKCHVLLKKECVEFVFANSVFQVHSIVTGYFI